MLVEVYHACCRSAGWWCEVPHDNDKAWKLCSDSDHLLLGLRVCCHDSFHNKAQSHILEIATAKNYGFCFVVVTQISVLHFSCIKFDDDISSLH